MKHSSTQTLVDALRILSVDTISDDGVANAAMAEAADRLALMRIALEYTEKSNRDIKYFVDDALQHDREPI